MLSRCSLNLETHLRSPVNAILMFTLTLFIDAAIIYDNSKVCLIFADNHVFYTNSIQPLVSIMSNKPLLAVQRLAQCQPVVHVSCRGQAKSFQP